MKLTSRDHRSMKRSSELLGGTVTALRNEGAAGEGRFQRRTRKRDATLESLDQLHGLAKTASIQPSLTSYEAQTQRALSTFTPLLQQLHLVLM